MNEFLLVFGIAVFASFLTYLGAPVAERFDVPHIVVSGALQFAAGIITALVAFSLMPTAVRYSTPIGVVLGFFVGGAIFVAIDYLSARRAMRRPTADSGAASLPRWLPDGSAVVFMSEGRDGNWDLYRANLADGATTRLTEDPAPDGLPAVSPDGQQIAFISKRSGAWGLWVMPANGGAATQITAVPGDLPDWLLQAVDWTR